LPSGIDASIVGESVRDSALPWDTVPTTRFQAGKPLTPMIESLTTTHAQRSEHDPNYLYQLDMIKAAEEINAQKSISLNLEKRRSELERGLARENERRKSLGLEPLASLEDLDEEELPDVLLDQAAGIVTDLAELRQVGRQPPQTASSGR